MRLEDFIDENALEALNAPLGEARGLPGCVYGEDFFELERRLLFPRSWCAVAVGAELPEPGDALPTSLAGWPLLLVRGRDGGIKAFHNICRHRGMRVVMEPCKGRNNFSCPWHGWTYDLDGRLVGTPHLGGRGVHRVEAHDRDELGLKPVRVGCWNDLVVVNIDGEAPPLGEFTREIDGFLSGYPFKALGHAGKWQSVYEGNWKIAMEGGVEEYHLPWGHPSLMEGVKSQEVRYSLGSRCHSGHAVIQSFDKRASDRVSLPILPGLDSVDARATFHIHSIFFTGLIAVEANNFTVGLFTPDGWNRSNIVFHFYHERGAAVDEANAEARELSYNTYSEVGRQDADYVKYVHENAQIRDNVGIKPRFSPYWEGAVRHFQKLVIETMREGGQARLEPFHEEIRRQPGF